MKYHYVTDKSMFIDFDADHPRLLTIATLKRKAEDVGLNSHLVIKQAMERPITYAQVQQIMFGKMLPKQIVSDFNIEFLGDRYFIEFKILGRKKTMAEALTYLEKAGLRLSEAMGALTIAVANTEKSE